MAQIKSIHSFSGFKWRQLCQSCRDNRNSLLKTFPLISSSKHSLVFICDWICGNLPWTCESDHWIPFHRSQPNVFTKTAKNNCGRHSVSCPDEKMTDYLSSCPAVIGEKPKNHLMANDWLWEFSAEDTKPCANIQSRIAFAHKFKFAHQTHTRLIAFEL